MALLSEADIESGLAGIDGWRREQDSTEGENGK